jgi:cell division protein FtsW
MRRSDRSLLTKWWFQIDRWVLSFVIAFAFMGLLAGMYSVHLWDKMAMFYVAGAIIFLFVPMMPKKFIIWASVAIASICFLLFVYTYLSPHAVHESKRWAFILGFSLMPADLMKPAFIVLTAWFLVNAKKRAPYDFMGDPGLWKNGWWEMYYLALLVLLVFMFFHPDLGNMFMYMGVFGAMIFWLGAKMRYILSAVGILSVVLGVSFIHPHFRARILGYSDSYQTIQSLNAIKNGGLYGKGDESFLFDKVPMANNDFVFSLISEMWGALVSVALLSAMFALFCLLFRRSVETRDDFSGLVIFGTAILFALHVIMNVSTALGLFMKGTTLPFISYGGSSFLAFSLLFAIVLSLIRADKWENI